jgi:hypothetical protein
MNFKESKLRLSNAESLKSHQIEMKKQTKKSTILSDETPAKTSKGRKSIYSQELADRICELLATHPIGLVSLCKMYPDLPSPSIIRKWLIEPEKSEFLHQYEIALSMRADLFFDEILEIADSPQIGETITTKAGAKEVTQADMIQHRRLRIDVRKWIVSKLMPRKYGDSTQMDIGQTKEEQSYQPPTIVFQISKDVADKAIQQAEKDRGSVTMI